MTSLSDEDITAIPGAFWEPDLGMFRTLLDSTATRLGGDLAELGVLWGRSAVLVGSSLQPGETFTVVDLFESDASDQANDEENKSSYPGLTQAAFEQNYLDLLPSLPVVVRGFSQDVVDHAAHGTHRFVHVDASHLYEHVAEDIAAARLLLKTDGVLVLDDFRAAHTPGVAAAAWQAVLTTDLVPFAVTENKMYATWGDPDPWRAAAAAWATSTDYYLLETQEVNGHQLLRIVEPEVHLAPPHPARQYVPPAAWPLLQRVRSAVRRGARRS